MKLVVVILIVFICASLLIACVFKVKSKGPTETVGKNTGETSEADTDE